MDARSIKGYGRFHVNNQDEPDIVNKFYNHLCDTYLNMENIFPTWSKIKNVLA